MMIPACAGMAATPLANCDPGPGHGEPLIAEVVVAAPGPSQASAGVADRQPLDGLASHLGDQVEVLVVV